MERSMSGSLPRSNSLVMLPDFIEQGESADDNDPLGMLSVNFRSTLDPHARSEKVKHMSQRHPAIRQSQQVNETLVCIQQSLRKMPGIASRESNEIIEKLKSVGVLVSQEWSQLVDALMHMRLDADEGRTSISRLTIEASVLKANIDDQEERIKDLLEELETVKADRDELMKRVAEEEHENKEVLERLQEIERIWGHKSIKKTQNKNDDGSDTSTSSHEIIKRLEETIRCLDEQVNERSAPWVDQNGEPLGVSPADATHGVFSVKSNEPMASVIERLRLLSADTSPESVNSPTVDVNSASDFKPGLSHSAATPFDRPSVVAPPTLPVAPQGYPSQAAGTPLIRPPSRFGHWNPQAIHPQQGRPQTNGPVYQSVMGRGPPPRQTGYHGARPRYRGNTTEFTPSIASPAADSGDVWRSMGPSAPSRDPYSRAPQQQNPARRGKGDSALRSPTGQGPDMYSAPMARAGHQSSAIHMTERCIAAWREQIGQFYDSIRYFVNLNAAEPDGATVAQLRRTPMWNCIPQCYNALSEQDATTYLENHLRDPVAKPCLVTRALVDFVINYVWTPSAWLGFDHESTVALAEVKGGLEGSKGQPSYTKQPYLDRLSAIITTIQKQSNAGAFHKDKVAQLTAGLHAHLMPLLNRFVSPATSCQQLEPVAELAWALSSKILTSRLTFDFRFPEVGSRFSNQCMVPIWPHLDPMELQAKHWRIALVTTPVVTCRNDTGNSISAHSIVHADVFCMQ